MDIIEIHDVVKKYNQNIALDHISFNVKEGEIFGLLGPNGAGKSTIINCICGLSKTNQGDIHVDGVNIKKDKFESKRKIGLVPQELALFDQLTGYENITFFGKLSGLRGNFLKERVNEALEFVGLKEKAHITPSHYSGGMKRRLNIACAIVNRPKIIIMDEPTVGIDPQSRNHILNSVKELNRLGSTIIYTSHYMEEVETICSRIGIMDNGRLIAEGTKEELKKIVIEEEKIVIDTSEIDFNSINEIKSLKTVKDAQVDKHKIKIVTTNSQYVLQDILHILSNHDIKIKGIQVFEKDLETVFLSLTGRNLRD